MSRPPLARLIRTPRDAEIAARDWLAHFGDTDTRLGPGTADGGVDVESNQSVVQVKAGETPTGRPVIQQTFGVAVVEQKRAMVFSVAPFTGEAVDWADQAGVSLFQLDLTGACAAVNELGQQIFDDADHRLSGWQAVIAELEALRSEGRAGSITSIFKLRSGFQGFFGIWVDAQGNTEAVRDFAGASRRRMANPTEAVEFVAAALRQIGGGYWDCRPVLKVDDDERRFRPRPTYEQPSVPSVVGAGRRPGQPDRPKRIRVTGSDVYKLVAHPSCVRRLFLEAHGEKGDPPTAFGTLLIETGIELERTHLDSLPIVADLSDGSMNERAQQTLAAIDAGEEIIYQGVLSATVRVDGHLIDAVGIPDFLIRSPGGYTIRDTKTAIRISETERPDIVAQLRFYAWLLPRMTGTSADRVEVIAGDGIVHDFPIHGPVSTEDHVRRAIAAKTAHTQPACGVKWSDRGTCPFFQRCWDEAIDRNDLAVVPGVPRSLASELRRRGIPTIDDLLHHHSPASLQDVQYRRGSRVVRVGSRADDILRAANALTTRRPIIHGPVDLPSAPTVILFDLEGIPRLEAGTGQIYLWGLKPAGVDEQPYQAVFADPGPEGDPEGWTRFQSVACDLLDQLGSNTPFVHWANYEPTQLKGYIKAYGDPHGVGRQVLTNLVDLLRIVKDGITLPVHSYSLKAVEEYVGFERSQSEFGGDWSITQWQEALEASSPQRRQELLRSLATYNEEDLLGMWAVYRWLAEQTLS